MAWFNFETSNKRVSAGCPTVAWLESASALLVTTWLLNITPKCVCLYLSWLLIVYISHWLNSSGRVVDASLDNTFAIPDSHVSSQPATHQDHWGYSPGYVYHCDGCPHGHGRVRCTCCRIRAGSMVNRKIYDQNDSCSNPWPLVAEKDSTFLILWLLYALPQFKLQPPKITNKW